MTGAQNQIRRLFIVGAGGLGREVLCSVLELQKKMNAYSEIVFVEEGEFFTKRSVMGVEVLPFSEVDMKHASVIIAIGESKVRERIASALPLDTQFATIVDASSTQTPYTLLGTGTIVLAQSFLSCDVEIGIHSLINPGTTISHDCSIGNFFSGAPGVHIGGNCTLGNHVFMGLNSCIRNGVSICDHVIIGMGGVVTKDITKSGTYVGNPVQILAQAE